MTTDPSEARTISVIIPAHNATRTLTDCLEAVSKSVYPQFECIVVDDCSTDDTACVARTYTTHVLELKDGPYGPAHARNVGANVASGEILYFIDADVLIRPDTLTKVVESFRERPHIDALFGSYDEDPAGTEFLTQYKNLIHHYVHQLGQEEASTFWSGCGAIRRQVFLEYGGFDKDRYPEPSIEDIELGYRLKAAGHNIYLNKQLQVKHLKRWSLKGLIKTDIFNRAVPWTQLIMQEKNLPNDLNLQTSQRVSALLLGLLLLFLLLNAFQENIILLPLLTALFLLLVNGWHWQPEPSHFRPSWDAELGSYVTLVVIGLLAYWGQIHLLPYLSAVLFVMVLVGRFVPASNRALTKLLFNAMMLVITMGFIVLAFSYPVWLVIPILLTLGIIVLLNHRLYTFFFRKRGIVFAAAVLPWQLFYYFYSVVTFVVSSALHYARNNLGAR